MTATACIRDTVGIAVATWRALDKESPMTDYTNLPVDLPVPEDDGAARHLPNTLTPRLQLPATNGTTVDFGALGPGRSVIYIYPLSGRPGVDLPADWDNIPGARGCTPEACSFRDHFDQLTSAGAARVYGLSNQNREYQAELVERLHLPFLMLSDTELALGQALKLPTFEADGRELYKRLTLIVRDGLIEHVFYPIFLPNKHAEQVLAWLYETA